MEDTLLSVVLGMEPVALSVLNRLSASEPLSPPILTTLPFLSQWELCPRESWFEEGKTLVAVPPAQGVGWQPLCCPVPVGTLGRTLQANLNMWSSFN